MAITEQRILPPEYIEALGKTYAADLTRQAGIPSITTAQAQQPGETAEQFAQRQSEAQQFGIRKAGMADLAPQVAAQDALQTAAYTQATDPTTGLGAYQPFLTKAGTAADAAGALTGPMTTAQTTAYMSPYQQQVIDASLADYDAQAAKSRLGLGSAAVLGGAFGSGRQGVAEAEFDALSNRGRSGLQANLLQSGFQQAQQARQQDLANQMGLANLQSDLGGQAQDFAQSQIAGLGTLGSAQQGQSQAVLDAQRQFAQMAVQEPINRLNLLGSGVTGLMGGTAGTTTTIGEAPVAAAASPLQSAFGYGLMGADIYGRIFGGKKNIMARILKRPMFNRGGSTNNGIMTGLKDRTGFANGTQLGIDKDRTAEEMQLLVDLQNQFAPVPKTRLPLGEVGANLVAGLPFGEAIQDPYKQFVKADDARDLALAKRKASALSTSVGQQFAERTARAKALATSKMQKDYTPQRAYETQVAANIESAGKLKSFEKPDINQKYPRATAEYDTYILRNLRSTTNETGQLIAANNMGFVPFDPKTQTFDYGSMRPGAFYYDPRIRSFVQRMPASDDDEGGIFIYDKNTFKKRKFEK